MKMCTLCRLKKPLDQFRFRNKAKGYRTAWCKPCFNNYERTKWKVDPNRREKCKERNYDVRKRNKEIIVKYLKEHPCTECGIEDIRVLEFDHLDDAKKSGDISTLANSCAKTTLMKEIGKCRVLCANCHRIRTSIQQRWIFRT